MSRFGGLSEERPSVFKTRSKLGTHFSTQCSGDERQSRPCAARRKIREVHFRSLSSRAEKSVLSRRRVNDGNQILITILEKFGLKINRNVCVSLAERDNRRIFPSRQRPLESTFEARRAKKIKKSKEIELFQEQEDVSYDPGAF
ncbi:hypothetical protein TNCV_4850101 [Trichonephila clavipes]|nr:hypothetical protein TNCV_4850101 [Trichonephila clavipes]